MKKRTFLMIVVTIAALAAASPAARAQSDNPSGATPFASFAVKGSIELPSHDSSSSSLQLRARFTLGEFSNSIFPGSEDITLLLEPAPSQANVPPSPCVIVALPAACLMPRKRGGWAMGDGSVRDCGFQFYLLFPDTNTKVDLTPFVTDASARLVQSPTDKSWELKVQIDLAGLQAAQVPPQPCIIVATVGDDRGATHVTSKLEFVGMVTPSM